MTTTIWWVRRDLRLTDNQTLAAALAQTDQVVPVFILDPALLHSSYTGSKRLAFMFEGLRHLEAELQKRGSRLIIRRGNPEDELARLQAELKAEAILAEEDFSPYARQRDENIAKRLPLRLVNGLTVHPPSAIAKSDGQPYMVYTPFSRTWKELPLPLNSDLLPAPSRLGAPPEGLLSESIPAEPALPASVSFRAGEAEALRRLKAFAGEVNSRSSADNQPIYDYEQGRNRLDGDGTSRLSPYLRYGMVSARQAVAAAVAARETASTPQAAQSAETWLNELIWREFYIAILYHFPQVRGSSFRPEYDRINWENDRSAFAAWGEGRTGYPVVDAAMRQLVETGWMPNRARMVVASFLVKDLLIDWRWGEKWFMQHLIDGDPAANNGGWQWTAGTGTDAAPYFRIFNPILQSQKYDPEGAYIRRWVPELAEVPDQFIHRPWTIPRPEQQQAGCMIGQDYPAPIVDHQWARERTLAAYARAREEA